MKIAIEIPDQRIADALCSAWEGGSNYWARADGQPHDVTDGSLCLGDSITEIPIYDLEDEEKRYVLTLEKVQKGLALMAAKAPRQLAAILAEDDDAHTGDCLLQLAIFGEIKYG